MEFLVHIEIDWPPGAPEEEREAIFARELEAGQALARAGSLRRIWRIPGRGAPWWAGSVGDRGPRRAAPGAADPGGAP